MFKFACFDRDHICLNMLQREFIKSGNGDIPIFAFPLASVISFCHTVAYNFLHPWTSTCQVSLCLYKNVVNEVKPSWLNNCLVLVDMENTIGCLGKKCKMIITEDNIIFQSTITIRDLCWVWQKKFSESINLHWLCCLNKWQKGIKMWDHLPGLPLKKRVWVVGHIRAIYTRKNKTRLK